MPYFSEIARPLTLLTSKYAQFEWTDEHTESFELLKSLIANECYLTMPDFSKPFCIFTDASITGCGAVLCQETQPREYTNIAFASKSFNETQARWDTGEREVYAIVWSCETFERYIKGTHVKIFTDHKNLTWPNIHSNPKVYRWSLRLQEYHFTLHYIKGEENVIADWLSRSEPTDDILKEYSLIPLCANTLLEMNLPRLPSQQEIVAAAKEDCPSDTAEVIWKDGTPFFRATKKLYVPFKYRNLLIWWLHASPQGGHQGINRTISRVSKNFGWGTLRKDVESFIKRCSLCICLRPQLKHFNGHPRSMEKPVAFQVISTDVIGPLKIYNNPSFSIHVTIDHCSRYMHTYIEKGNATAESCITALDEWITHRGAPRVIVTDRGSVYRSKEFTDYVHQHVGSAIQYTSPSYPQGNGINESSHQLLKHALKTFPSANFSSNYKHLLRLATMIHNASPHPSIGTSPFEYLHGCDMVLPFMQEISLQISEPSRRINVLESSMMKMLTFQLHALLNAKLASRNGQINEIKLNDVVTFPLTPSEADRFRHLSGIKAWNPTHSFPWRVIHIKDKQVTVKSLWTNSLNRSVPLAQLRKLLPDGPRELKDLVPLVINCPSPPILREPNTKPFENHTLEETPECPVDHPQKRQRKGDLPATPPPDNVEICLKEDASDPRGV